MRSASCIVGAGYSCVGGLPPTKNLFDTDVIVVSKQAKRRVQSVWQDYDRWRDDNPVKNVEEYFAELYDRDRQFIEPLFRRAIELVAAVLASPTGNDIKAVNPRYGTRITQRSGCHIHTRFWRTLIDLFANITVVTTNYDLMIERALRHRPMLRPFSPGFFYGGFKRPQILKGSALPFTISDQQKYVELTGTVPLFKIHGSLSWAVKSNRVEMFQDMRPAFRCNSQSAIIPPLPEKASPPWLKPVWDEAEKALLAADRLGRLWLLTSGLRPSNKRPAPTVPKGKCKRCLYS